MSKTAKCYVDSIVGAVLGRLDDRCLPKLLGIVEAARQQARDEALEEALALCPGCEDGVPRSCIDDDCHCDEFHEIDCDAIRKLKGK